MNAWDYAILAVAAYVAITSLVRLMRAHCRQRVDTFRQDYLHEQRRQALLDAKRRRLEQEKQTKTDPPKTGAA